jgi:hypothetical protein
MCQRPIPFGPDYEHWRQRVAEEQEEGNALWYLGHDSGPQRDEPDATLN